MAVGRVAEGWAGIEDWLARHATETYASLRPPADPTAVAAAERAIGVSFPADLVASLARHDGCADGPGTLELAGRYQPLSVAQMVHRWRGTGEALREFMTDDTMRGHYWHPEWPPFAQTNSADMLVLDCRPGGSYGAVGVHLEGDGTRFDRWASLGDLLAETADALHRGRPMWHSCPVAFAGRLRWELVHEQHPAPRSVFALAAAGETGRAGSPGTGRGWQHPARPHPPRRQAPPHPEAGWVGEFNRLCLTFVSGVDSSELLRRYSADPGQAVPRDRQAATELAESWTEGYRPVVRVGRAGGWAFAAEEADAEGARPEALRRLSAGTRAMAVHYLGNATRFALFEDGTLVTGYDTRWPERPIGSQPQLFAPALRAAGLLPVPADRYPDEDLPALLGVLRTELGIELDPGTLFGALPSAQYQPVLPAPPVAGALPARLEPAIAGLIRYADEPSLRSALLAQTRRLTAETGLDSYPEVTEALDRAAAEVLAPAAAEALDLAVDSGRRPVVDDESPLGRRIRQIAAETRAAARLAGVHQPRDLMTEAERAAWARRRRAAEALLAVFGSPTRIAVSHVLMQRLDPDWRAQFATDLGPVAVPDGAAEELIAEEDAAREANAVAVPLVIRPQRRRHWPPGAVPAGRAGPPPTLLGALPAGMLPPPPPAGRLAPPPATPQMPGSPSTTGGQLPRSPDPGSADHRAGPPERADIEETE